jgi:hypothetical protein
MGEAARDVRIARGKVGVLGGAHAAVGGIWPTAEGWDITADEPGQIAPYLRAHIVVLSDR